MTGINIVNNSLSGTVGSGSFVGSDSPVITGSPNLLTTFEIPNNTAPTISSAGHIALDTSVTSFKPTIVYHNGTASQALIAVKAANLSTTDGHVIAYDSVNQEFKMQAASGVAGKAIIQYNFAALGADATTTSTSPVSPILSASITPTISTNKICCEIFGSISVSRTGGVVDNRSMSVQLARTVVASPTDVLITTSLGRVLTSGSSSANTSLLPFKSYHEEIAGSTSSRTYSLYHYCNASSTSATTFAGTFMYIYELEV